MGKRLMLMISIVWLMNGSLDYVINDAKKDGTSKIDSYVMNPYTVDYVINDNKKRIENKKNIWESSLDSSYILSKNDSIYLEAKNR